MIQGGTSAAGKSGNLRTGYSQKFIPCQFFLVPEVVRTRIQNNTNLTWNAYVQIEDLSSNLVTISEVTYFQVQKVLVGGIETASISIDKPSIWSIWGATYQEVLRPSKRRLKIYAGLPGYELEIFTGRITNVVESRGSGNLGAINLTCSDFRSILAKEESTQTGAESSRYYEIYKLALDAFDSAQQVLAINDVDSYSDYLPVGDSLKAVNELVSGQPAWGLGSGAAAVGGNQGEMIVGDTFSVNDSHINYATRGFADSSAYNVATARGLSGGVVTEQEVTDAADIAKRGRVVYPQTIGSDGDILSEMVTLAQTIIARSLAGYFSVNILFNPYLLPGQVIKLASSRFSITETNARLYFVRHQYKYGSCLTALDGVEILT
jgi:hypothetical protein